MTTLIKRTYDKFKGVDFYNEPSKVDISRSPDSVNMYKDYSSDIEGECITTRMGYTLICEGVKINGIHHIGASVLIHDKNSLYLWSNYPSYQSVIDMDILYEGMNDRGSTSFVFEGKLYINDGLNYLVYNGIEVLDVVGFVPTTSISRAPSGGGEIFQGVNVLSTYRINTFVGDSESREYFLDSEEIEGIEEVKVNDVVTSDYTSNLSKGSITFSTAPPKPGIEGLDNVYIKYKKEVEEHKTRINKCTLSQVFDNRVFFSGNEEYGNGVFHSGLNDPTYVSDLFYYQDGVDNSKITSMVVGENVLFVLKAPYKNNATIFFHTPSLDSEYGKVYPVSQSVISLGCIGESINFLDDIVFLSPNGLEAIGSSAEIERLLFHRSTFVDGKMVNKTNYLDAKMIEWREYLLILVNGYVFLADSKNLRSVVGGFEYEWFYWDFGIRELKNILMISQDLLFYSDNKVYILGGSNDNGQIIKAHFTTILDDFGKGNKVKTTNKKGFITKFKTLPNSKCKIAVRTNETSFEDIGQHITQGFDFCKVNFGVFAFISGGENQKIIKVKRKKWIQIQIKYYIDELDKSFGLFSSIIEAFLGRYVK